MRAAGRAGPAAVCAVSVRFGGAASRVIDVLAFAALPEVVMWMRGLAVGRSISMGTGGECFRREKKERADEKESDS